MPSAADITTAAWVLLANPTTGSSLPPLAIAAKTGATVPEVVAALDRDGRFTRVAGAGCWWWTLDYFALPERIRARLVRADQAAQRIEMEAARARRRAAGEPPLPDRQTAADYRPARRVGDPRIVAALRQLGSATFDQLVVHLGVTRHAVKKALNYHRGRISRHRAGIVRTYWLTDGPTPELPPARERKPSTGREPGVITALRTLGEATVAQLVVHLGSSPHSIAVRLASNKHLIVSCRSTTGRSFVYRLAPAVTEPLAAASDGAA